jgi:uncharacterized protein (TIGR03435 family)
MRRTVIGLILATIGGVLIGWLLERALLAQGPAGGDRTVEVQIGGQGAPAPGGAPAVSGPQSFEVASVKENKSGEGFVRFGVQPGGRFTATNVTLRELIRTAYQLQNFQLVDVPNWAESNRYDIVAKAPSELPFGPPGSGPGPLQFMMQALLAERFNLKAHRETQEMAIYALVMARADGRPGPNLRPAAADCAALAAARRGGGPPPAAFAPGERMQCGMRMGPGQLSAGSMSMTQFANSLAPQVSRVVLDRTGLTGNFDFEMTWTPDRMPQGNPPPGAPELPPVDPNGPSIFTALQEQLGLKLDSTRGPVEVLVIDSVSQPTPD